MIVDTVSRLTVALLFFLSSTLIRQTFAVKCTDCEGNEDCFGRSDCHGDYCMIALYTPKLGHAWKFGETTYVKGCITGNLMKKELEDECEHFTEGGTDVQMCVCNDADFCNHKIKDSKMKFQKTKLVPCFCNTCGEEKFCQGEFCTFSKGLVEGEESRKGCSNRSLPIFERQGEGACMQPPISPVFLQKDYKVALNRETCICASPYCNGAPPVMVERDRMTCEMTMKMTVPNHVMTDEKLGQCKGEHCFDIEIKAENALSYSATGCMSFAKGRNLPDELNEKGCVIFNSSHIEVKACFDTTEVIAGPGVAEPPKPKGKKPKNKGKQVKPVAGEENQADSPALLKVEENGKGANKKVEATTEGEVDNDGNTTIVAVFVVIMVIIVIAGIVWKFELHKKIFQARYQTVAG